MKNARLVLFIIFASLTLTAPLSRIWKYESALRRGKLHRFRTQPVDPYDAFRGRYVTLSFRDESLSGQQYRASCMCNWKRMPRASPCRSGQAGTGGQTTMS
jgi:uncharacterized membrane-anchored protein